SLGETRVGRGSKIDNLVQVGHNVLVGERCILVGQVGLSGSCRLGEGVVLAGQVGVADGVRIAPGVTVTAQAGVASDLSNPGGVYGGWPAMEHSHFRRVLAAFGRLPELARRVRRLEEAQGEPGGKSGAR
ncbi:MAG: UDP-3-O-(3-hydroxymyristoyl)glucosamine N-acyltransferase, partial [Nitrospinota bacterium]